MLRRWVVAEEATTRAVVGSWWRAQRRGREAVDEERGAIVVGGWLRGVEDGGVCSIAGGMWFGF